MEKFKNIVFQVNGGPWKSIFAAGAEEELPANLHIYDLVKAGVTFGALDHYEDTPYTGLYRNIKFRVEEL